MRTRTRHVERESASFRAPVGAVATGMASWFAAFAVVAVAALLVLVYFLSIFAFRHFRVPLGWDSMDYVWRTRLSQSVGISHLRDGIPPNQFLKSGRPGFLVLAATLSSLEGVSVLRFAMVLPGVMGASLALAAGVLARRGAQLPPWGLAFVALVVGASINVALMIQYGYVDNLIVSAIVIGAAGPVLASVEDARALVPAIFLLSAASLVEVPFFVIALAAIGLTAAIYLPSSWRRWRSDETPLLGTPSARLGAAVLGSGVVAAITLYGIATDAPSPRLHRRELARKLRADVPRYRFSLFLPAAAVGAVSLARPWKDRGQRTRLLLTFLLSWSALGLAAFIAFHITSLPVPANRFLLFAFGIPILTALGLLWLGSLAGRFARPRWRQAVKVTVALVGLAGIVTVSGLEWGRWKSFLDPAKLEDAAAANAYLSAARIPVDRPVVFIVDDRGPTPVASASLMRDHIAAILPPERIRSLYVYFGSPEDFLAHRPTKLPGHRSYELASYRIFTTMQGVYTRDPVALILPSFNDAHFHGWADAHPDTLVPGHDLAVVRGPPPVPIPPVRSPVEGPHVIGLAVIAGIALLVLAIIGLGWTIAFFPRGFDAVERLAAAPAVGAAVLVVGGFLADRVGVRVQGIAGWLTPVALAVAGWLACLAAASRGASGPGAGPPESLEAELQTISGGDPAVTGGGQAGGG